MPIGNFKALSRKDLEEESGTKPTRFYSKKQENSVAKSLGGKRNLNSGATPWQPGDVSLDSLLLIECKTKMTDSKSITIHKNWLIKNLEEAVFSGKEYNTLAFNFGPNQKMYYILDEKLFFEFLEYLKEKHSDLINE